MGGQGPAWAVKATDDDESSWYKELPLLQKVKKTNGVI
jgi:hypothetical protein